MPLQRQALLLLSLLAGAAAAQDLNYRLPESSAEWTEYHVAKNPDGGAAFRALGCGTTDDGERVCKNTRTYQLRGAKRDQALTFGDVNALPAVKRELKVGDGGTP